ncbi:hypothetical protein B296_00041607 [Ensete ventricosum]|uniref:Uncharacterized protein n=1 Tax=Ensete ventricosum TaxID=4639 RepID=A0A426YSZ0_ENSVE|nr:hypothetical protein B296_00041607 [Ensete ventricosum]
MDRHASDVEVEENEMASSQEGRLPGVPFTAQCHRSPPPTSHAASSAPAPASAAGVAARRGDTASGVSPRMGTRIKRTVRKPPAAGSGADQKEGRASTKRSRGVHISSAGSPTESQQEGHGDLGSSAGVEPPMPDKEGQKRPADPQATADAGAMGEPNAASTADPQPRKLPVSLQHCLSHGEQEESARRSHLGHEGENSTKTRAAVDGPPINLIEVIKMLSGEPSRRFAEKDILDIAKMKGIEFPPPWWSVFFTRRS